MKKSTKIILSSSLAISLLAGSLIPFNKKDSMHVDAYSHSHDDFVEWSDSYDLPSETGNYYLTNDVVISETYKPAHLTRLCLNGHSITLNGEGPVIEITRGAIFYLHDCGTQTHKYVIDKDGLGRVNDLLTEYDGTFTGGYITGGNSANGGGIFLNPGSKDNATQFFMYGGTIIGNKSTGNGGGINYNYEKGCKSWISLEDASIIGNVADGIAGGIYHQANNIGIDLFGNTTITKNISGSAPAAILEQSGFKIGGKPFIYDNHLKTGEESDVYVGHSSGGQPDRVKVETLLSGSRIGIDDIRTEVFEDFFYYNADKDPNDYFSLNNNKLLGRKKKEDDTDTLNATFYAISATGMSGPPDGYDYSIQVHFDALGFPPVVKYGESPDECTLDESPTYSTPGNYTVYVKATRGFNVARTSAVVSVSLYTPEYIYHPSLRGTLNYNGEYQRLLEKGMAMYGVVQYKIGLQGEWQDTVPLAKDVGTYDVYYRIYGDKENQYGDTEPILIQPSILENDKTDLVNKINLATAQYNELKDTYPLIARILNDVIDEAKSMNDNPNVTVDEISEMVSKLDEACQKANKDKEAISVVENLINEIGEVSYTSECKDRIDKANNAYLALDDDQKELVDNRQTLFDAISSYKVLDDKHYASIVVDLINNIGDLAYTDEFKIKIDAVRAAYDSLSDDQKAYVDNYPTLLNYESSYLKIDKTVRLINNIGDVSYDEETKTRLAAARAAYDALSDEEKALISDQYNDLVAKEEAYHKLESDHNRNLIIIIVASSVGGLLVLLILIYLMMFFVFNKWVIENDKNIRVIQLSKKDEKVKLLTKSFKVIYKEKSQISKKK